MHPKGLYEPELVKRWRERLRRFELSELLRGRGPKGPKKPAADKAPTGKAKDRAKTLVDA
ncbi:MAG: hypothetical protein ACAH24_26760 [Hyphomicrobiaceae bacterium]|jgi:hypothetical protein